MTLRAKKPILCASRQYGIGDALPASDQGLVQAWLDNGVAFWDEVDIHKPAPKAKPVSVQGKPGRSSDGDPNARVGRRKK